MSRLRAKPAWAPTNAASRTSGELSTENGMLALAAVHERLPLLLLIPLLAMLSLSFAYGRVLMVQKTFANSALYALSYDIASRPALRDAKRIYMSVTYSDHWLSGAAGSFKQMPVLHYLLNIDFYMLAENLPKVGINNV